MFPRIARIILDLCKRLGYRTLNKILRKITEIVARRGGRIGETEQFLESAEEMEFADPSQGFGCALLLISSGRGGKIDKGDILMNGQ